MTDDRKKIFESFYRINRWRSQESRSGPGSEIRHTRELAASLENFMLNRDIGS